MPRSQSSECHGKAELGQAIQGSAHAADIERLGQNPIETVSRTFATKFLRLGFDADGAFPGFPLRFRQEFVATSIEETGIGEKNVEL